jgi:Restriction endonuclease
MGLVTRVSGRAVAAISLLLYLGVGLALPLGLRWSVPNLIAANFVGTTFAALVSVGWLVVQLQARDRRHLVEWTTDLRLLSAEEFEWLIGELFRREGWKVREVGRQDAPDGNIDLELTKGTQRQIVQCKRWTAWLVGVDEIRAFAGTLMREGLRGSDGVYVTLSDFTEQASGEARRIGVSLINNRDLYDRVEKVRRAERCPICQAPMLLDRSLRGWWFRCVTEGCSGKLDLGNDPARAIDLLTQPPPSTAVDPTAHRVTR